MSSARSHSRKGSRVYVGAGGWPGLVLQVIGGQGEDKIGPVHGFPFGVTPVPMLLGPSGSPETQDHFLSLRSEAPRLVVSGWLS